MSIDDFQPVWLDPQGRCLYAALHREKHSRAPTGVVLVPPLLHEQPTSRRFLTEVAAGLAAQGLPSLRFDFRGTGDSSGSGDELDFSSMSIDLGLAVATLGARTGAERVVLLAWRGAALAVGKWLQEGGRADLVVLWEPITDGAVWLEQLQRMDASERAERPRVRPGVASISDPSDGQLMGFPVSPRLREHLVQARLAGNALRDQVQVWALTRPGPADLPMGITRRLTLPAGAPVFGGRAAMDKTFFLTPPIRNFVDELGESLREQPWQSTRSFVLAQTSV